MAQQPAAARARQPLADYELLGTIGEGRHAKVKLGRHLLTGIEVAVKVIPRRGFGRRERPVLQEAESMLGLRHPHIVQLFQLIETEQSLFLVMEHLSSGDLCDHMETHGRMAEGAARHVFRQLVSAVQYCHAKGVIHRDLKPQNVLLDLTLTAKLTDFSLSSPFGAGKLGTLCGTPSYMAPEVFGGEEYDGPPVDIWSLGVVLYQMVTGTTPFKGNTLKQLMKKICRGVYVVPKHVSGQLQHLLRALIAVEPKDRRPLAQVMTDGWLNLGHTEELRPFAEPEGEDLDPGVEQEMVAMGFAPEDIQRSLAQKAYDHTMATYLILATERARIPYRTILVRPRGAADPHGPGASADLGPGQEAEDSVGPSGSAGSGKATARRSPKSKKASVQRRAKHAKVSPRHSPKLPSDIERPSRKFRASTARGGPKRRIAALPPDCGLYLDSDSDPDARPTGPPPVLDARPTGPPPVLDARPTGPPPVLDATPTGPPPVLDARPTGPPPVLDATPTGPPPVLDARPTGPPPVLDATPTGPPPVLDARPTGPPPVLDATPTGPPPVLDATPTGPPPVLDAGPTGPPPVLDARPTGPPPVLDATPTGPPPVLDATPTGPPPVLDAGPTGPPPVLDAGPTGPPPVLDAGPTGPPPVLDATPTGPPPVLDATPTGPPPVLDAGPTGPPPVLDAGPTGPPPVLDAGPTGPPPVLDATPTGPPPVLDAGPTGPSPVLDAGPTGPPPVLDAGPTGPPPVLDATPTGPPPVLDAGPTGPPPQPKELRTTPPTENREQKNGTARPAPQIGPGDSPSTHNVRSSSCERAEGESQGRRGLARRCLNLLRKLCCLPPKKGYVKSHQIQPL